MIEIKNVSKKIGRKEILKDVNCVIEKGTYGLLGPNGAGKTTLIRCIMNLYKISNGQILVNGRERGKNLEVKMGYLPQSFGLFKELNVYDSMKYFCNLKGITKKKRKGEIERCLHAVNMENEIKKTGNKLSGGMIRRVGVAQALLNNPECIFFDEPTAGLDPEERQRFKNIILNLDKKATVVISTHIVEDIEACCDKVIIMDKGQVLCVKNCRELVCEVEGKVIACEKGQEVVLKCDYYIEKQYENNGKIFYRVIISDPDCKDGFQVLKPTIEDGYMAIIKGL